MSEENVFDNIQGVTYHFSKDGLLEDWREEALRHREEIERLENIIKEVREYIEIIVRNTPSSTRKDYANMLLIDYKKLLEILDKAEE